MHCPYCNYNDSKVIDSRESIDGIRRRRECLGCERRYTTYERVQTRALIIIKRDGRREEFSRDKLWASIAKACAKRPLQTGTIDKAVNDIEADLTDLGRSEIPSSVVGEMAMERLKKIDRVAYIRFASVYREFKDIETFQQEIKALLDPEEAEKEPSNQLSFLQVMEEDQPKAPKKRRGRRRAVEAAG
ncbi:MAG: transcriptional repressor NrdR [SAR202 cluster bacterium]|nr:transcriptional repressor NrdR [SAR202 cluster bacterium]